MKIRIVKDNNKKTESITNEDTEDELSENNAIDWKDSLLNTLKDMQPDSFERLSKRLLRESGFEQVEVTGKAGDEGIDGKGIVKINGIMSFHVYLIVA